MAITLESTTRSCIDRLCGIELECFDKEAFTKRQIAMLMEDRSSVSLLAKEGDKIVGFIIGMVCSKGNALGGHILTIDVLPEHRRKGIGLRLIQQIEELLVESCVRTCFLEVRENNTAAISLYKKAGYKRIRKLKNYYEDAHGLFFEKELTHSQ